MATISEQILEGQKLWSRGVDTQDIDSVNEYLSFKLREYDFLDFKDDDLWEQFTGDFADFTEETFKNAAQGNIRKLRNLLRTRGVWILREKHTTVAQSLYNTLQEKDLATWNIEEIMDCINRGDLFNSPRIKCLLRTPKSTAEDSTKGKQPVTDQIHQLVQNYLPSIHLPPANLPVMSSSPVNSPVNPPDTDIPPVNLLNTDCNDIESNAQSKNHGKEIANLIKLYIDKAKYSGEKDNFDYKLTIFLDLCSKANVPQDGLNQAYSTMLRGLALDHYYTNLKNNPLGVSFNQLCNATRNYFEGPEYKRGVLKQWNAITLRTVIDANVGKSTTECLQLLIKQLRHLQHGLDINLKTDDFLHNKLITAC